MALKLSCASESPQGLSKHSFLGPTPRLSDVVGLGEALVPAFPVSSWMVLRRKLPFENYCSSITQLPVLSFHVCFILQKKFSILDFSVSHILLVDTLHILQVPSLHWQFHGLSFTKDFLNPPPNPSHLLPHDPSHPLPSPTFLQEPLNWSPCFLCCLLRGIYFKRLLLVS